LKQIFRYIKGTVDFGLFYRYSNSFDLVGYSDNDWVGNMDDRALRVLFSKWKTTFAWSSNKQSIVTLSTCEFEYVDTTSYVCHFI